MDFYYCRSAELCDCESNNDDAAVEAALFDGADRCNDVRCGDKLIAWTVEILVIIIGRAELHRSVGFLLLSLC